MRHRSPFLSRVIFGKKAVIISLVAVVVAVAFALVYVAYRQPSPSCSGAFDIAIIGGEIIDGLGGVPFKADIGVRHRRIVCIGKIDFKQAHLVIDANGFVVAPGFIDVHTHIERNLSSGSEPFVAPNFVRQGVTSIITGNCGRSFPDLKKAFRQFEARGSEVNVASFVGHNTIRHHVMSDRAGPPSAAQLSRMKALVGGAMNEGALGLSTGLEYVPGAFASTDEIVELAKVVRVRGGMYVSHLRNEASDGVAAINEALLIGSRAGVHVHISHFKAQGPSQWGTARARLDLLDAARNDGVIVSLDQYPYAASSTGIGVLVPSWVSSGGTATLNERLQDPTTRAEIRKQMLKQLKGSGWKDYSFARVAYYSFDRSFVGLSIPEIARTHHVRVRRNNLVKVEFESALSSSGESDLEQQADTILDLFSHGGAQMVFFNMSEEDVEAIMCYHDVMFGSDSGVREEVSEALPHPRGLGTFPRILGVYARDKQILSLPEAVRRITSLPAETFGLRERGRIKEGYYADLVVFDRNRIADKATYDHPLRNPEGIHYVFVNGSMVLSGRGFTKSYPGMVLRRKA